VGIPAGRYEYCNETVIYSCSRWLRTLLNVYWHIK